MHDRRLERETDMMRMIGNVDRCECFPKRSSATRDVNSPLAHSLFVSTEPFMGLKRLTRTKKSDQEDGSDSHISHSRPSPPHLWRPTAEVTTTSREIAIQDHGDFVARERPIRRNSESFKNEADLSPQIPAYPSLWTPPRPPQTPLLDLSRVDGSRLMGRVRHFLSLPDTATVTEIRQIHMLLNPDFGGVLYSPFLPAPHSKSPILRPFIWPIVPRGLASRTRDTSSHHRNRDVQGENSVSWQQELNFPNRHPHLIHHPRLPRGKK